MALSLKDEITLTTPVQGAHIEYNAITDTVQALNLEYGSMYLTSLNQPRRGQSQVPFGEVGLGLADCLLPTATGVEVGGKVGACLLPPAIRVEVGGRAFRRQLHALDIW